MSLGRPQQGPLSDEGAALHQSQPQGPEEITDLAPAPTVRLTSPQARSYGLSSPSRRSPGAGNSERDALLSGGGNDGTGAGSDEERAQGTAHKRKWWMRGTGSTRGDGWENESPYDSVGVRIMFAIGVVMLFLALLLTLVLIINLFAPLDALLPPHRSPGVTSLWFALTALLMVGSSLQIFEIVSTATRAAHFSTLGLLALCGTFLGSLEATRTSEGWLGGSALALCGLACIWALAAGEVVGGITQAYYLQTGVVAHLNVQQAQGKWGRRAKIAFAVLGTTVINILVALLAFNLALRGWDAGLKAPGSRYWVSVSLDPMGNVCLPDANNSLFFESLSSQAQTSHNLRKATFRIHLACEEAPAPAPSASRILGNDDKNKTKTARPTALVMTERGVAGEVGAQWVRDMVARPPRKTENGTDDGHLALERVCFWDRPGYGHSDVVPTTLSLPLLTHALHKALKSEFEDANGNANEPSSGHGNDSAPAMGPFMLISTGYGALVSRHFASTFPDLVHSHLLIDSETPTSWYGELDSGGQAHPKVSAKAGLRGGYGAPGHTGIGLFLFDVLPTILEPLGITRIMGLVAGFRARDRLLAAWGHGGATWGDAGGGGWRLRSAGGANAGLLATSLSERLDANAGPSSMNYRALNDGSFPSHRPTAVLSSFWKLHADEAGWGDEQRQTIAGPAKDKGALVGWWRVGSRTGKDDGGDRGAAEGICAEERGRVWCEEAVRKLIVAGDLE